MYIMNDHVLKNSLGSTISDEKWILNTLNRTEWEIAEQNFDNSLSNVVCPILGPTKMSKIFFLLALWIKVITSDSSTNSIQGGILYPRESESREVKSLDGIWNFRLSDTDPLLGFKEKWYSKDLSKTGPVIPMPVPSSYNDITVDKKIRDHVGFVWYDKTFFVPDSWRQLGYHVWLRFSSVHYAAQVWINGHLVMSHEIGHLPFHREIASYLQFGKQNRVTVAVDNTLLQTTLPQGTLQELNTDFGVETVQSYTFDFFNYAGIHRSVHLYTTPAVYIDDIHILTDIKSDGTTGLIHYNITIGGAIPHGTESIMCVVDLLDHESNFIVRKNRNSTLSGLSGTIEVPKAKLWWPYLMDPNPGYMYTLQVQISEQEWGSNDVYRQPVGIRSLTWNNTSVLINGKPIYLRGFGRHEDSNIRGKGLDLALVTRDYNLLKWIGANAYRTSHYPYAEEIMDFADQQGIMIIDECPGVDVENYSTLLRKKHMDSMAELIRRDKNRPSVIMWSIANEPRSQLKEADDYFKSLTEFVRSIETSRPLTAALNRGYSEDLAGQYLDVIGFNRYNAWYSNPGRLEVIQVSLEDEATKWHKKYNKPVFMSEYGADTMPGLHLSPSYVWSEEYQIELFSEHFKAFDNLRKKNFFIGEMIWNFADFNTAQTTTRVGGNKKGVFTRERQPKSAAFHVRRRYWYLAKELDRVSLPSDIRPYEASMPNTLRTEL
ncbi:beta-glucuronidase isoform X1 [Planococcus citri]|uniref:beta-glucuronidase isoform X1 n=2 Tax=Planococcus citri TaxID=170843 RepID=UPI0031F9F7ED